MKETALAVGFVLFLIYSTDICGSKAQCQALWGVTHLREIWCQQPLVLTICKSDLETGTEKDSKINPCFKALVLGGFFSLKNKDQ